MKIREKLIIGVNLILFIVFFLILLLNKAYIGKLYIKLKQVQVKRVLTQINKGEEFSEIEEDYDVRIVNLDDIKKIEQQMLKFENNKKRGNGNNSKGLPMDNPLRKIAKTLSGRAAEKLEKGRIIVEVVESHGRQPEAIVLIFKDKKDKKIAVISPLTKIDEVLEILQYYSYLLLIMCLLASGIVLSIFSYGIAKPLIKIKGAANKMANLDFSQKIDIKSGDEIQELGESINNLSIQLETNIERLKDDIKEKEKANEIQRRFFSTVSHELKTPLAIIQGYASGLKDNVAPEKVDFYCEVINDEVKEMSDLITTLLNKMKYESESIQKEKIEINRLLNEIIQKYKIDMEEKSVKLNIDSNPNTIINADREALKSVMVNFLTNAISFVSDYGQIEIAIKEIDDKIRVSIFNSGKNIPEDKLDDIWKPFYRVEASQNRKFGGTGLGLSIVKDILEKHEAEYGVKNLEQGVEFYFLIKN